MNIKVYSKNLSPATFGATTLKPGSNKVSIEDYAVLAKDPEYIKALAENKVRLDTLPPEREQEKPIKKTAAPRTPARAENDTDK